MSKISSVICSAMGLVPEIKLCMYTAIGLGDGGRGHAPPPKKKKNPGKIFFGQFLCKKRAFFGQKFANFVNFRANIKIRVF